MSLWNEGEIKKHYQDSSASGFVSRQKTEWLRLFGILRVFFLYRQKESDTTVNILHTLGKYLKENTLKDIPLVTSRCVDLLHDNAPFILNSELGPTVGYILETKKRYIELLLNVVISTCWRRGL